MAGCSLLRVGVGRRMGDASQQMIRENGENGEANTFSASGITGSREMNAPSSLSISPGRDR